jgi:hypothetical protein
MEMGDIARCLFVIVNPSGKKDNSVGLHVVGYHSNQIKKLEILWRFHETSRVDFGKARSTLVSI